MKLSESDFSRRRESRRRTRIVQSDVIYLYCTGIIKSEVFISKMNKEESKNEIGGEAGSKKLRAMAGDEGWACSLESQAEGGAARATLCSFSSSREGEMVKREGERASRDGERITGRRKSITTGSHGNKFQGKIEEIINFVYRRGLRHVILETKCRRQN
ncbi:uncharacterized protein LOC144563775 [Carex rostrata]